MSSSEPVIGVALVAQRGGDRAHRRAANADEMEVLEIGEHGGRLLVAERGGKVKERGMAVVPQFACKVKIGLPAWANPLQSRLPTFYPGPFSTSRHSKTN